MMNSPRPGRRGGIRPTMVGRRVAAALLHLGAASLARASNAVEAATAQDAGDGGVCGSPLDRAYPILASALLCWGVLYMFFALAVVCDEYFVASLEVICDVLHLSDDVAGATFMAAGSSAPELFAAVMGVFAVENDVGVGARPFPRLRPASLPIRPHRLVRLLTGRRPLSTRAGTIVGSAVFNLTVIIGSAALFASAPLALDWRPITRDTACYTVAIVAMLYVIHDGVVSAWEASLLVMLYALYVLLMRLNAHLMAAMDAAGGACSPGAGVRARTGRVLSRRSTRSMAIAARPRAGPVFRELRRQLTMDLSDAMAHQRMDAGDGEEEEDDDGGEGAPVPRGPGGPVLRRGRLENASLEASVGGQLGPRPVAGPSPGPSPGPSLVATAVLEPIVWLLEATVPNTNINRRFYLWAFTASCVWIGIFSYLMVIWATKLGCIWGVDPAVMGVTVLAAGTSVPDAISSLVVAAKGQGDMAVSNAIGSNVFDVLLGLGLPWAVATVLLGRDAVAVDATGLVPMATILFMTVLTVFAIVLVARWHLTRPVGATLVLIYVLFATYEVLAHFGVLGTG